MAPPWPLVRSGRIHDASDPTFQAHSGLVVIVKLPEPPPKENEVGDEFAATAHLSVLGAVMDVVDDDPHADTRTQTRARERPWRHTAGIRQLKCQCRVEGRVARRTCCSLAISLESLPESVLSYDRRRHQKDPGSAKWLDSRENVPQYTSLGLQPVRDFHYPYVQRPFSIR